MDVPGREVTSQPPTIFPPPPPASCRAHPENCELGDRNLSGTISRGFRRYIHAGRTSRHPASPNLPHDPPPPRSEPVNVCNRFQCVSLRHKSPLPDPPFMQGSNFRMTPTRFMPSLGKIHPATPCLSMPPLPHRMHNTLPRDSFGNFFENFGNLLEPQPTRRRPASSKGGEAPRSSFNSGLLLRA